MGHRAFYISALYFVIFSGVNVPWVTDVFLACSGNFWCWLKADTCLAVGRSRKKKLFTRVTIKT